MDYKDLGPFHKLLHDELVAVAQDLAREMSAWYDEHLWGGGITYGPFDAMKGYEIPDVLG